MQNPMQHILVVSLFALASASLSVREEACNQRFHGCRVDYRRRECLTGEAVGCKNPFPYSTLEECQEDFRGQGNICEKLRPCRNGGECLQVQYMDDDQQRHRSYKCDCHATGFYGRHCENRCTAHPPRDDLLAEACLF